MASSPGHTKLHISSKKNLILKSVTSLPIVNLEVSEDLGDSSEVSADFFEAFTPLMYYASLDASGLI